MKRKYLGKDGNIGTSLKNELEGHENHLEYVEGAQEVASRGVGAKISQVSGNPLFVSQFDINITLKYYELQFLSDEGVGSVPFITFQAAIPISPSSLPSNLKVDMPAFIFGNSDFASGFKNAKNLNPVVNWNYATPKIVKSATEEGFLYLQTNAGLQQPQVYQSPSVTNGAATIGDLIIPLVYQVGTVGGPPPDEVYLCEVIINCKQVGYGTLLDSISSDRFIFNAIRYKIPNETKTAQYEKQIQLIKQSLFGKISNDRISPASYQLPTQFQNNIVDVPLTKGVDKESLLATYLNYDVGEILWSFYVPVQNKVVQDV